MDLELQAILTWLRTQISFGNYHQLLDGKGIYSILRKVQNFPQCNIRDGSAKAIYICNLNTLCDSINRFKNSQLNFDVVGLINNCQTSTLKMILQQTLCICVHSSNNTQFVKAIMGLSAQVQSCLKQIITRNQLNQLPQDNQDQQESFNHFNLLTKIDQLTETNLELNRQMQVLKRNNTQLKNELQIKDSQLANWHSSNSLFLSKQSQLIEKLRDQILELSRQKEIFQFQIISLQQKLNRNQAVLQAKLKENELYRDKYDTSCLQSQTQVKYKQLITILASNTNLNFELKKKNSQLQLQLHNSKLLTQKCQIEIQHLKKQISDTKQQLSKLVQSNTPTPLKFDCFNNSTLQQNSFQFQQLTNKLILIQNQLLQQQKALSKAHQENANLRTTIKSLKKRFKVLETDKQKLQQNILMLRTERGEQNQILVSTLISLWGHSDRNKRI